MKKRVVITGIGVVSPLGCDLKTTWKSMLKGESGVGTITLFDASTFPCRIAAEVKGFDIKSFLIDEELLKFLSQGAQFGVAAAQMAMIDAKLALGHYQSNRIGISIGCSGSRPSLESLALTYHAMVNSCGDIIFPAVDPVSVIAWSPHSGASIIALLANANGPNNVVSTACSSSSQAIGTALRMVQQGVTDMVITGGYDSMISEVDIIGFSLLGALSTRNEEPQKASRPFDRKRDGFVIGEGATIMILENLSCAVARGVKIYAELVGFGCSLNDYSIVDSPLDGRGAVEAMERALSDANLKPSAVHYINAHGTSTPTNDVSETTAIKRVFGEYAYRLPISSTKSMTGHLISATGALELAVCVLSLKEGIIPPTINYEYEDAKCDLHYVPNKPIEAEVKVAMSNSFAFGGSNSCLIVKRYDGTNDGYRV
ncbi:beta-ketoacyl-[acyl-carrier-protein] synthase family protein [Chloroflexota bacterium]